MPLLGREEGRTAPDDLQLQHYEECAILFEHTQLAARNAGLDARSPVRQSCEPLIPY